MRELVLMRHAEAVATAIDAEDFSRPLTESGRAAAALSARQLRDDGWTPQLILCSSALRTSQTADIVRATLARPGLAIQSDAALYGANARSLRSVIAHCDTHVDRLLLIAHNPGVSQLLAELAPDRARLALGTAEFQLLPLPLAVWSELVTA
jgi:phosphohistidine phosphatase